MKAALSAMFLLTTLGLGCGNERGEVGFRNQTLGGASIDPTKTQLIISGNLTTNNPVFIEIDAYDVNNNPLSTTNSTFEIAFTGGPPGASIDIDQPVFSGAPGIYNGSFTSNTAGVYAWTVKLTADPGYDGNAGPLPQNIQDSPASRTLRGPTASDSYIADVGVTGGKGRIGTAVGFTIVSADSTGNISTGGDPFDCVVSEPNQHRTVPLEFNDINNGTYPCSYFVTKPGAWRVSCSLNGVPLKGSPYRPVFTP